jgi:hypothetical protein
VLEVRALRRQLDQRDRLEARLIGNSSGMARVRGLIGALANSAADVLIHGETGTGKELVARCLHDASPRARGNFVAINCGGLPETLFDSEIFGHEAGAYTGAGKRRIGKIEHASGGTLFLDEIESMPLPMQIKLLRVLQERTLERLGSNTPIPVDCRVIAATKEDLLGLEQGRFRADLYYRLSSPRCHCRRCASGARTSRCCSSTSCCRPPPAQRRCRRRRPAASSNWSATPGRAMCASCATWPTAACSASKPARRLRPAAADSARPLAKPSRPSSAP